MALLEGQMKVVGGAAALGFGTGGRGSPQGLTKRKVCKVSLQLQTLRKLRDTQDQLRCQ